MPSLVDNVPGLAGKYDIVYPRDYQAEQRAEKRRAALAEQQRQAPPARAGTAAGPSKTSRKRKAVDSPPFEWPHCPPSAKRPRYTAVDFQTPFSTEEQIRSWYSRFAHILSKRNFYVLQEHHATAGHWDLRIQLDGGLVSFCIPKGIFDFEEGPERRYVVWQPVHPISDCLVEGGLVGDKKVDSVGLYTMRETVSQMKKHEAIRRQGFDDAETTDEDEDAQPEDERQEDLFAQAYYYTLFKPLGFRWGQPAPPSPRKDPGKGRAFVIELNGARFKGVRLLFFRNPGDIKYDHSKSTSTTEHVAPQLPEWMVSIHKNSPPTVKDTSFGKKSILTNRTLEQVRAGRAEQERLVRESGFDTSQWEQNCKM